MRCSVMLHLDFCSICSAMHFTLVMLISSLWSLLTSFIRVMFLLLSSSISPAYLASLLTSSPYRCSLTALYSSKLSTFCLRNCRSMLISSILLLLLIADGICTIGKLWRDIPMLFFVPSHPISSMEAVSSVSSCFVISFAVGVQKLLFSWAACKKHQVSIGYLLCGWAFSSSKICFAFSVSFRTISAYEQFSRASLAFSSSRCPNCWVSLVISARQLAFI